jgi:hypothetical protein
MTDIDWVQLLAPLPFIILVIGCMFQKYRPTTHVGKWFLINVDPFTKVSKDDYQKVGGSMLYYIEGWRDDRHDIYDSHYCTLECGWRTNYELATGQRLHSSHLSKRNRNRQWIEITEAQAKLMIL